MKLPLVADVVAEWNGLRPSRAVEAPQPDAPQGEYAEGERGVSTPRFAVTDGYGSVPESSDPVELLAPAGGPDAAFAAFHYGADAIYLGLKKFSARAEAENFTLDELSEVLAYAHALTPRRRVFVTLNTLIRDDELPELLETLAALDTMGVDALILQDLGVYYLARKHFPQMELHASTQLAVHNRAGAVVLRQMGFRRVVLARELTTEEVEDITRFASVRAGSISDGVAHLGNAVANASPAGIETEVFIHGALCYSYSGLCLFSSQTLGRSGNRGKCAYSCRDSYTVVGAPETLRDGSPVKRDPRTGFPFSMKDLALPDHLPALRTAGVSCFKIEGRKKSPLYVATTTDYYRQLIDGRLDPAERATKEADLQTVFSRPWTRLFTDSHKDKEVADRDTVGHRGTIIGRIESVRSGRLRFRTTRAIERHDGLQVDLPILAKPFGFAVDRMWLLGRRPEAVYEAPAGSLVEVELPLGHPELPLGAPVYCSSSQRVKRDYRHDRPKPGLYRMRRAMRVELTMNADSILAVAMDALETDVKVMAELSGPFQPARDPAAMEKAVRTTFDKLGDTSLTLETLKLTRPADVFVPVSRLNQLRRELCDALEDAFAKTQTQRLEQLKAALSEPETSVTANRGINTPRSRSEIGKAFRWSVKVDRISYLDAFDSEDWADLDEVVIDVARDHTTLLADYLETFGKQRGRDRIRLSLPPLTRKWEERGIVQKIERLCHAGWNKWEVGNLSGWEFLGLDAGATTTGTLDIATDWSVYAINRAAGRQLLKMGVSRFCLSPEDGLENMRSLLAEFGSRTVVIVHQDTPQFLAESCAYANLIGGCPGKAACKFESMEMESSHGERVLALDYHCRTIVLDRGPLCLSRRLSDLAAAGAVHLRADFVYRPYDAATVAQRWRDVRAGRPVPGGHAANFDRGVL